MKTTGEIITQTEYQVGDNGLFLTESNKKWFSEEEIREAIDKVFICSDDSVPFLADIRKKEFLEELGL